MIMDKFEKQFEDLDVQVATMETSMGQTVTQMTPQEQVDSFMQQVADENGLELQLAMPGTSGGAQLSAAEKEKSDALEERLAKLRNAI
jgi:charged multivesicular body protein 1